ncbi:unnamed protein product [Phaedon cochleariae]|uniref:Uncharacterized protein n=1 Tax=Phaedon cochleariae TaxID=80249 RepID=A0A9P0DZW9_PHACE|nr:unnamed protein product [Phaedon cochleariae]
MLKPRISVLIVWILFKTISCEVCSDNAVFKCYCTQLTDPRTHLPVSIADCSSHNLQDVPDDLESHVNHLDLSMNNIEVLNSAAHKLASRNLHVLILNLNRINTIDPDFFQDLPNLRELDLRNNLIPAFESAKVFQGLKELHRLDLSHNNIVSLPEGLFLPLVKLRYLDLSYSSLGGVLMGSQDALVHKLGVVSSLTHLSLDGLNITEIPSSYFDDFTELVSLSLADNALAVIPVVPYSVEKLDMSGNNLTVLSPRYLNYHALKVLKLNRMPSLTYIQHYAFYNLYALEKLSITDCPNLKEFSELAVDVPSKNTVHHPKVLSLARNGLLRLNESYSCSSPGALRHRQILQLKHEDLPECFPEIYGKWSHRVLIVGLTCGIIVLCGLIFYLLRYPINLKTSTGLSPSSPYSRAPTNEGI